MGVQLIAGYAARMTGDEAISAQAGQPRVHTHYVEQLPDGSEKRSPILCHASRRAAHAFVLSINHTAGPEVTQQRVWRVDECTCAEPSSAPVARYVSLSA